MLYTHNSQVVSTVETDTVLPPVSSWLYFTGIFLVGTVTVGVVLSSWIKYNVTVKAAATVRPTGEVRVVQSQVEGTVKSIFVKENQLVKSGDKIAQIDNEELLIERSQVKDNIQQSHLQIIQIDAQINALGNQIAAENNLIANTVNAAKSDLSRNQREYQERQINTKSEWLATLASSQKSEADVRKAQADLEFAKVDRDRYQQLAKIGAIGRREFEQKQLVVKQLESVLQSERKSLEISKLKILSARVAVNPSIANVTIAQERVAQEIARGESSLATLNKEKQQLIERRIQLHSQIKQYQQAIKQLDHKLKNSIVVATSSGIILKQNLRNPGQVIRMSESIAEIVPANAKLVIKAKIPAGDINKVVVGKVAKLRINSCPYPDYGTLDGVVKSISPDVITNREQTASSGYFEATIEPAQHVFGNQKQQCQLQPGMQAQADIITQEETALQFMLRKARLATDL
jgi:HlyD family secretion protein